MRKFFVVGLLLFCVFANGQRNINIVFTSDLHLGLKRGHFNNESDSVTSNDVNIALAKSIQSLGKIDYLIVTGDIVNRQEISIQTASTSWKQFLNIYKPLHIPLLLTPGNHDISNAIGHYKPMIPLRDASSLAGIYAITHPHHVLDTNHLVYSATKFNYSKNIGGIHFVFITIWPDSANRIWMEKDLKKIDRNMPVFVFTHDPPEGDPRHFINPNGRGINPEDRFEDLLSEVYTDNYEKEWDDFLRKHSCIKGYFHGHSNYQEFYTYKGVEGDISLPSFRVDSPMKGKVSAQDGTKLSYQLIIIHPAKKQVEIKEVLWNAGKHIQWGERKTIQL